MVPMLELWSYTIHVTLEISLYRRAVADRDHPIVSQISHCSPAAPLSIRCPLCISYISYYQGKAINKIGVKLGVKLNSVLHSTYLSIIAGRLNKYRYLSSCRPL
jgi:hypothetical protein